MTKKSIGLLLFATVIAVWANAQPKARRNQQEANKTATNANNITVRSQIAFPTAAELSEDVVWRRDVYRLIDLQQPQNRGLYEPVEPDGAKVNLFTCLFKLMMTGNVPAYEYRLDGLEHFTDDARIKPLAFLDNYHIYYEKTPQGIHIDNSDIPGKEVTAYYVKESSWYNQTTSTFHTKVVALCPILKRVDDFGDASTPYPLFWMKYDDLAPFLAKQMMTPGELNQAVNMSVDDYFTMNLYKGDIYKTAGTTVASPKTVAGADTLRTKAQRKIEEEIAAFEKNIWGNKTQTTATDSLATAQPAEKKKAARSVRRTARATAKPKKAPKAEKSTATTGAARVTVRRQRH